MDTQDEQVAGSSGGQDQGRLPAVPIPAQERQQLISRLPPDIAPVLKAAADSLSKTADAQVSAAPCSKCYVDGHVLLCTPSLLAQLGAQPALYKWQCSYALLKLHHGYILTAYQVAHNGDARLWVLIFLL